MDRAGLGWAVGVVCVEIERLDFQRGLGAVGSGLGL